MVICTFFYRLLFFPFCALPYHHITSTLTPCHRVFLQYRCCIIPSNNDKKKETFTATGNEVLVESAEARVYHVRSLCDALELTYEAAMLEIPDVYTLTHIHARLSGNCRGVNQRWLWLVAPWYGPADWWICFVWLDTFPIENRGITHGHQSSSILHSLTNSERRDVPALHRHLDVVSTLSLGDYSSKNYMTLIHSLQNNIIITIIRPHRSTTYIDVA